MGKMFVFKGMNGFMPRLVDWSDKKIYHYDFKFNDNCVYNFEDEDKYDWNKLMGISYNFSHNRGNVLMVGWRYVNGLFELAPYEYKNGKRFTHNPIFVVRVNEWFSCKIDKGEVTNVDGVLVSTPRFILLKDEVLDESDHGSAYYHTSFSGVNKDNKTREIYPWFGGTKSAPHYMSICRVKK